jgi:hypothetical protein
MINNQSLERMCELIVGFSNGSVDTRPIPLTSSARELSDKTLPSKDGTCGAPWAGDYEGTDFLGNMVKHAEQMFVRIPGNPIRHYNGNNLEKALNDNLGVLGERPLVVAGHYMPNVLNPNEIPENPLTTLRSGLEAIKRLRSQGKEPTLLLYINDIHMTEDQRREFYSDYRIPQNALEEIKRCIDEVGNFRIKIISEEYLLRNTRNKKRKVDSSDVDLTGIPIYEANKDWLPGEEIRVYQKADLPTEQRTNRCTIATAGLIDLPRRLGNTGMLIYIPICGYNGEAGMRIGEAMYASKTPRITIMSTKTCY